MTKKELAVRAEDLRGSSAHGRSLGGRAKEGNLMLSPAKWAPSKPTSAASRPIWERPRLLSKKPGRSCNAQSAVRCAERPDRQHRGDLELSTQRRPAVIRVHIAEGRAQPQALSTVALRLKKTDAKKGKYTLNVTADDRTIEKKDKNASEPVQFYTGRDHMLYELVVWSVDKNKITGYLSTPKNAPIPVSASQQ
jgi:hypothetical protein